MIGRINSAAQIGRMNRVVKRKEAEGGWWLAGGISPSDCVAAYQAKGAASYAASKVNLANPGTYDAIDGATAPTWNTTDGWIKTTTAPYLLTGIEPDDHWNWSFIVRMDITTGLTRGSLIGNRHFRITGQGDGNRYYDMQNGFAQRVGLGSGLSGVMTICLAKDRGYINGVDVWGVSIASGGNTTSGEELWLLKHNSESYGWRGKYYAMAIYKINIAPYLSALITAMNAL